MTIDNWINLITAMGTLAAVVVAIRLASAATRKAKENAMVVAKLAASSIVSRLKSTLDMCSQLRATCTFTSLTLSKDQSRIQSLATVRTKLQSGYYQPDASTLVALAELPAHAAHRIASAFDHLDSVKLKLAALGNGLIAELTTPEQRETLLLDVAADIDTACDLLQVGLRECIVARDLGAPHPSGEELHGNAPSDDGP